MQMWLHPVFVNFSTFPLGVAALKSVDIYYALVLTWNDYSVLLAKNKYFGVQD